MQPEPTAMATIQASPEQTLIKPARRNRTEESTCSCKSGCRQHNSNSNSSNDPILSHRCATITACAASAELQRPHPRVQAGSHTPRNQQTTPTPPATPGAPTHEAACTGATPQHAAQHGASTHAAPTPPTPRLGRTYPPPRTNRALEALGRPRRVLILRLRPATAETARPVAASTLLHRLRRRLSAQAGRSAPASSRGCTVPTAGGATVLGPNATSQKAEIIGAYSAALLVLDYITNTYVNGEPIPEFVFRGDSSYVCNKFPSSEELSEHVIRTVRATNTSNKEDMLLLLDALTNINFKWRFEWVPRQYNAPADELANAVMDDRQPCRDIVAYEPQAAVTLQEDALRRLWDLARAKRVPLFHRLPYEAIRYGSRCVI
jgi:ribonuclease HI